MASIETVRFWNFVKSASDLIFFRVFSVNFDPYNLIKHPQIHFRIIFGSLFYVDLVKK